MVTKHYLTPTTVKDSGFWGINTRDISLPDTFIQKESWIVSIPPNGFGGNHKHPRQEAFIGSENLELIWQDDKGVIHKEIMTEIGKVCLFIVSPYTPHAVVNTSNSNSALLFEFADDTQHDVEVVNLF